jgi:phosphotransferase system enzyme I (PtsI)
MRKGIGVSPGVAVGTAYCIHEIFLDPESKRLTRHEIPAELRRYERAVKKTLADLHALANKVASQVGGDQAAIFRAHEAVLRDPAFSNKIRDWISNKGERAAAALHRVLNEYTSLFARTKDPYLKERLVDVREVIVRLSARLSPLLTSEAEPFDGPLILVANELLPSQIVALGEKQLAGIVTQSGAGTSHAAILARGRGIPAVSGVAGILKQVKNGDTLVVDGRAGQIEINPDPEMEKAYFKLQREFFDLKDTLAANRNLAARSADGETVELLANVNGLDDARSAVAMGAQGVGLFRTEYLFLSHPDVPDEEEQLAAYRKVVAASPNRRATIRTLDLGGDKTIPYLSREREANPFMGWRSIRLSFEHPDFFLTQIRAILRASAAGRRKCAVRILFPMITTLEEMRRVRRLVERARRDLAARRQPLGEVPIGLMLEVPAAAVAIESLLTVVDFVSIGSNDLVQYLMAADRDNPKVSHLCQPLSPAVLRVLVRVIDTCRRANKPVTLCGEMAGQPRAFVLLYGMGLRSYSMSPAFIPSIKELTSHLTQERAAKILRKALALKTTTQVVRFMGEQIEQLAPNLKLLNTA